MIEPIGKFGIRNTWFIFQFRACVSAGARCHIKCPWEIKKSSPWVLAIKLLLVYYVRALPHPHPPTLPSPSCLVVDTVDYKTAERQVQRDKTIYIFLLWEFSTHPVSWTEHRGTVFGSASRIEANNRWLEYCLNSRIELKLKRRSETSDKTQGAKKNHSKYSFVVLFV